MAFRNLGLQTVNRFVLALDRGITEVSVFGTTTETTLFSTLIPGSTLGDEKCLRGTFFGELGGRDPSVGGDLVTIRIKLGSTTVFSIPLLATATTPGNLRFGCESKFHIVGFGSLASQKGFSVTTVGDARVGLTGTASSANVAVYQAIHNAIAENSLNDLTLTITADPSVSNADIGFKFYGIFLELV